MGFRLDLASLGPQEAFRASLRLDLMGTVLQDMRKNQAWTFRYGTPPVELKLSMVVNVFLLFLNVLEWFSTLFEAFEASWSGMTAARAVRAPTSPLE